MIQLRICLECSVPVPVRKGQWRNNVRCWSCAKQRGIAIGKIVGIVQRALKSGRLVKSNCEVCGSEKSEAHHDDYAAPLSVRWLCRRHHKIHHSKFGPGVNAPVPYISTPEDTMGKPTFTDWLAAELSKKLDSLPSDQARYRHLILCHNAWRLKYMRFLDLGEQPFNEPHPVYGEMDAFEFSILLADMDRRKRALENSRVTA